MKVTSTGAKGSQLFNEGSTQRDSTEHERYAGVHHPVRITENNNTNADESEKGWFEKIVNRDNLNQAFKKVKSTSYSANLGTAVYRTVRTVVWEASYSSNG